MDREISVRHINGVILARDYYEYSYDVREFIVNDFLKVCNLKRLECKSIDDNKIEIMRLFTYLQSSKYNSKEKVSYCVIEDEYGYRIICFPYEVFDFLNIMDLDV